MVEGMEGGAMGVATGAEERVVAELGTVVAEEKALVTVAEKEAAVMAAAREEAAKVEVARAPHRLGWWKRHRTRTGW